MPSLVRMRPIYWMAMVTAALTWASGGVLTRAALIEDAGPWTVVAVRVLLATILLGVVIAVRRMPMPSREVLKIGVVISMANLVIPYVMFTFSYNYASVGFVGVFTALIPIATAVAAKLMLPEENLTTAKVVALVIAFIGVALLLLSGDSGLAVGGQPVTAAVLAVIAVVSVGYASAYAKRHAGKYEPITITFLSVAVGTPLLLVIMGLVEGAPVSLTTNAWVYIVGGAVAGTVLPFLVYFWLLERIPVTNAALIGYMVPFIGLFGGIVFLGEKLQPGIVLGFVFVLFGLYLSDRASRREVVDVALVD